MSEDYTLPITKPSGMPTSTRAVETNTYPTEIVELPSSGFFYAEGSPLTSGKVELKMMTAKEEDILTNENLIKKGIVLDKLLESLIVDRNIDAGELLVGDKNALFYGARRLAYGDAYGPLKIECNKCKKDTETVINLGLLERKDFDFTNCTRHVNLFSFDLPVSKVKIQYKLLTSKDESLIDSELKGLQKLGGSGEITVRLKHLIVSINGATDKAAIKKFVDNMPSRDSMSLREHIRKTSPNMATTFLFTCENCGHAEGMAVPMTVQFFWPESSI